MKIQTSLVRQGYYDFGIDDSVETMSSILQELELLSWKRTPLSEEDQSQFWSEASINGSSRLASWILPRKIRQSIEAEWGAINEILFWANHYSEGEYIPRHRDSEGHLQILAGVLPTQETSGGKLILYQASESIALNLRPAQRILFDATSVFHETTPPEINEQRLTCVARLFLSSFAD